MKLVSLILLLHMSDLVRCQEITAELLNDIDSSRVISFCECVHGSDQLEQAQVSFIKEMRKYYTVGTVFLEYNNLYLGKSKIASEIKSLDSTIVLIGYNPGYLNASFQIAKKDLTTSNPTLLKDISRILNKLDSNEAYYWYVLKQSGYDSLLMQLHSLQDKTEDIVYKNYIDQLYYDLSFLKYRKILGDKIRDSFMYEFIIGRIHAETPIKYIILGHCGHLALKNPYLPNNLGFYLKRFLGDDLLTIGNDGREMQVTLDGKERHKKKKKFIVSGETVENGFVPTTFLKKRKQPVFLIGADYNLRRSYKLVYSENYDWLFYLDIIKIHY